MFLEKNPKFLKTTATMLVSFFAGALFVVGGFTAYYNFLPSEFKSGPIGSQEASQASVSTSQTKQPDITGIVKSVSPAIVNIETLTENPNQEINPFFRDPFFREFFGNPRDFNGAPRVERGLGTGFIINKEGYIITNEHVVHGAQEINVKLTDHEKSYKAKVIGSDFALDLAVIKIDSGEDLPFLPMGDSDKVNVGDWSIAIGNPYGLDHTVTVGVISAKGRPVNISSREYKNLLQTDAAINPGNSGGPLLNMAGEVIGINTAVNAEAQGIGFAIPTATVKDVLKDLLEKGKVTRPYLGVYLQSLTPELADYFEVPGKEGLLIGDVIDGSPAEKVGLKRGDVIQKVNKKPIKDAEQLQDLIQKSKVNDKLVLEIFRDGHKEYVTVTLAEKEVSS